VGGRHHTPEGSGNTAVSEYARNDRSIATARLSDETKLVFAFGHYELLGVEVATLKLNEDRLNVCSTSRLHVVGS
jgi:hypothetical protein